MNPIKFLPRGNALFIVVDGKSMALKDHPDVKAILEEYGTSIVVTAAQGQPGNYAITLDGDSWSRDSDVSSYDRVATLVGIHDFLTQSGVPTKTESGEQVLNLQTAGPRLGSDRGGRLAVLRLYFNLSVLNKTHSAEQGGTVADPMEERLSNATAAYVVQFGISSFSDIETRFAKLGKGAFAGILEGLVNKAKTNDGGSPTTVVEEPQSVPTSEGGAEELPV